ncbi:nucleotidyltransferase family protein [Rhodoferax mekongensis]|uniref:nucleotidyltransferase family protein n=1 Tax=Rhodoferax mekongensis TaxID=3068341 RepID=UPI0028BDCDDB|nr:nucleotidyltransferase family protein [Rhodoferax sp. TBRC 17199]MDT7513661.1 nucleotidyltransferase family protein [Rhodoferax sp. TBRC 17199]
MPDLSPSDSSSDTASPVRTSPAIVLAAGRGERMRPLTDTTPKPLLQVHGKPLMQYHLEALAAGGFASAVVNTAWLGEQIEAAFHDALALQRPLDMREQLSNSEQPTASIHLHYSHEGRDFGGALETAGGIARALPQLDTVFWSMAGDVFAPDMVFTRRALERFAGSGMLAHLWLVPNPAHNTKGDFGLEAVGADGIGRCVDPAPGSTAPRYTYSTFALFHRDLFAQPWCDIPAGNPHGITAPLAPLLRKAMQGARVSAEIYTGRWTDVGTPERLAELNAQTP